MPGFVPTKTQIRFASRMSVRGERWAYFEGVAYLLDARAFFLGRGDEAGGIDTALIELVRTRFDVRCTGTEVVAPFDGDFGVSAY
jgi:hypothetical protein